MTEPRDLTLYSAAEAMRRGRLTSEALVRSCLERIEARESTVHAWANLYADEALEEARACDRAASSHQWCGPLHGLPLGIKDIYDVRGQTTEAGTAAYPSRIAGRDADSVGRLREAGAIVLGKTVTTAFAMGDANKTCNPWNPAHTPGGSSQGSGAGVADRMCMAALGTQTNGSVIRPASYNGVVGFKPGYGRISIEGVIPLAWQLDHVGSLTRSVEDAHLLWHLMRDERSLDWQTTRDKMPPPLLPRAPRRIWRVRDYYEQEAHPAMVAALDTICAELARQGVEIVERRLPPSCEGLHAVHHTIMASEAAAVHQSAFRTAAEHYPPKLSGLIREGLEISATQYVTALRHRLRVMDQMHAALSDVDAAIFPAAPGPAPEGLDSTGDPSFNSLSSLAGLPVVCLPVALAEGSLPLGLQLLGGKEDEDALLGVGAWCESVVAFPHRPGA